MLAFVMIAVAGGTYHPAVPATPNETVEVAPYLIDRTPVTNAQFDAFVGTHPEWKQPGAMWADTGYRHDAQAADAPATEVSWFAARAYCAARSARLPTEGEWELAFGRDADPKTEEWVLDFAASQAPNASCNGGDAPNNSEDWHAYVRSAYRSALHATDTTPNLGFRCAAPTVETPTPGAGDDAYALGVPGLDTFRGQTVIISLFYGSCPSVCPVLIAKLASFVGNKDVRVLLVSFDPARDADFRPIDDPRWKFLPLPEEQARAVAALVDFHYRRLPDGNFRHDGAIIVVGPDGKIVKRAKNVDGLR